MEQELKPLDAIVALLSYLFILYNCPDGKTEMLPRNEVTFSKGVTQSDYRIKSPNSFFKS